ncbi:MAG TPA: HAD-IA family hydrolase [Blastocatellia bacterium]|jgi:HAD superfamily hydrolase (TIGR01509 family)|nr:HAD-IA family hydrolase [Blastocatellia bacterium]
MNFDCYIFDFDGTLAHSEPAYREAFLHTIRLHTGLEVDEAEFRDFWNMTPAEVLRRYSVEMLDEMLVSFEEHYYANHHHHLTPYDGIAELLESLTGRGARVAVVSLKPRRAGEIELDITGLRPLVGLTVWGDDVARPKPAPDGVLRAMDAFDVGPRSTLVIGDSPADIMMGRAAGTRTAAALWGGASTDRLLAESPDLVLNSPGDLLKTAGRRRKAEISRR